MKQIVVKYFLKIHIKIRKIGVQVRWDIRKWEHCPERSVLWHFVKEGGFGEVQCVTVKEGPQLGLEASPRGRTLETPVTNTRTSWLMTQKPENGADEPRRELQSINAFHLLVILWSLKIYKSIRTAERFCVWFWSRHNILEQKREG